MQQLEISQSHEVKRCSLFQLHRVTTPKGERLLVKSIAFDDGGSDLLKREQATFAGTTSLRLARAMGLVHVRDQLGACYADFAGVPLPSAPVRDLEELTRLTREMCAVLDDFHGAGLLLLGLSPRSFLRDSSGRLQLIDGPERG